MKHLESKFTEVYPTRYAAFDDPKILFRQQNINRVHGGFEFAVYHEPITNRFYPHIEDGIHAEIVSYQGRDYLLDGDCTIPEQSRAQFNVSRRFTDYRLAESALETFVRQSRVRCGVPDGN